MSTHTPGPWELWTSNSWRRITSRATGSTVCEPVTQRDGHPDLYFRNGGEDGPDARLLIAAPDLLAACKLALGAFERNDCINWDDLARAIAKAEGKPTALEALDEVSGVSRPATNSPGQPKP